MTEFEKAVDGMIDYWEPVYDAEQTAPIAGCGLPRNWNGLVNDFEAARANVLALYADAKHAGLRELLAWGLERYSTTTDDSEAEAYRAVGDQIHAMLNEAADAHS